MNEERNYKVSCYSYLDESRYLSRNSDANEYRKKQQATMFLLFVFRDEYNYPSIIINVNELRTKVQPFILLVSR
jgi:hypothetical protein